MLLESMVFAMFAAFIVYIGLSFQFPKLFTFQPNQSVVEQMAVQGLSNSWGKLVSSIGAGVFEEFLFRFLLLNGLIILLEKTSYENEHGETARAILLSSLLFTLVHLSAVNIGSLNSILGLGSIFVASVIFSIIYLKRGYAIAAGTHIFYDIYLMFGVVS